ncbi:hypothetical protein BL677_003653 [Escherichia coli]|nr:hypothetical protein [Escherichia coli]
MKTYGFILLILHIIPMGAWFFLLFITNDENKVEKNTKPHRINISIMAELGRGDDSDGSAAPVNMEF